MSLTTFHFFTTPLLILRREREKEKAAGVSFLSSVALRWAATNIRRASNEKEDMSDMRIFFFAISQGNEKMREAKEDQETNKKGK